MSPPNDAIVFPNGVYLNLHADGQIEISPGLEELLLRAREGYVWRSKTPADSQAAIIELETKVNKLLQRLTPENAKIIFAEISRWGGNRAIAQANIESADSDIQSRMAAGISKLADRTTLLTAIDLLSDIPGLKLIIASKVYRFCYPNIGAAVDRHASYFFNSLDTFQPDDVSQKATKFRREWFDSKHASSRLAIYQLKYYVYNLNEYIREYLPLLIKISDALNAKGVTYTCAASGAKKRWRPADIEMAAFFWWSKKGPK